MINECQDNYTYYLQSFCFDKDYPYLISISASLYLFCEIVTCFYYLKRITWKVRKISNFDPLFPEDKTYSRISLHILQLMRVQLMFIILSRIFAIAEFMSLDSFKDWYYTSSPDLHFANNFNFCKKTILAHLINLF